MTSRRNLLFGLAGLVAGTTGFRYIRAYFEPLPEFELLEEPLGFRRIMGGASSNGFDPFVGLGSTETEPRSVSSEEVEVDICGALYGEVPLSPDTIPIASFSDYYCPYCRVQTKNLAKLGEELGSKIQIVWHELPLLGEPSRLAAKAALSAKRQGAYLAFHERLLSSPFQATPEYLELLAKSLDVDHDQLKADMMSDDVARELDTSSALSEIFAFFGTPALVIGRTVVQGKISNKTIRSIIDIERAQGWAHVC